MEASKFWNLINLFTPESWMWIFGTIIVVVISLQFATYVGQKLEVQTGTAEIVLLPYRFFNISRVSRTFKHQSVNLSEFFHFKGHFMRQLKAEGALQGTP